MRPYNNGVPKNAFDLALDICGSHSESTIVGLLVTAGAQMTGNSKNYQERRSPYQWRRVKGPQIFFGEAGYQGPRMDPAGEAHLRRMDRSARVIDSLSANTHLDVGPVTAESEVGDNLHPPAAEAGQEQTHTPPDVLKVELETLD